LSSRRFARYRRRRRTHSRQPSRLSSQSPFTSSRQLQRQSSASVSLLSQAIETVEEKERRGTVKLLPSFPPPFNSLQVTHPSYPMSEVSTTLRYLPTRAGSHFQFRSVLVYSVALPTALSKRPSRLPQANPFERGISLGRYSLASASMQRSHRLFNKTYLICSGEFG
jgi:hypothetical protein